MNTEDCSQGRRCQESVPGNGHSTCKGLEAGLGQTRNREKAQDRDSGGQWGAGRQEVGDEPPGPKARLWGSQEEWWEVIGGVYTGRGASGLISPAGLLGEPTVGQSWKEGVRLIPRSTRQVTVS